MLSAGRLDTRIVIEERVLMRGPSNEPLVQWATMAETWAEVKPMSVSRVLAAQAVQSKASVLVTIRYRTGVARTMRIRRVRDGAIFALEADPLPDDRSGLEWLTMMCSQGITDGE